MFRGIEPAGTGFIMGHEFVGEIVELGSAVKNLQKGDRVVTAFTTSWYGTFPHKAHWQYAALGYGLRTDIIIARNASTASKGGLLAVIRAVSLDVPTSTADRLNM
jgi:threonine dehydrogenase-like Zn-dependent dehydrogenase